MFTIAVLQVLILGAQIASPGSSILSTCDLQHPEQLSERAVEVRSLILFTSHGAFLRSDSCATQAQDVPILYPGADDTPKVQFNLDPGVDRMLKPFRRPMGPSTTACAVLTGQVFDKKGFRVQMFGGGPQGNGFGPRGAFRLAFVIRSVKEIHPCNASESR